MVDDVGALNLKVVEYPATPVRGFGPDNTATTVESDEQLLLDPLVSVAEYGGLPPANVTVALTVTDCPRSIPGGERARVGEKIGFTVRVAATLELVLTGTVALSTTVAQKNIGLIVEVELIVKVVVVLVRPALGTM
jgi:hypothetical protein